MDLDLFSQVRDLVTARILRLFRFRLTSAAIISVKGVVRSLSGGILNLDCAGETRGRRN